MNRRALLALGLLAALPVAAGACAERVAGVRVELQAAFSEPRLDEEERLLLADAAGHPVRLQRALLVVQAVELLPCEPDAGLAARLQRWLLPVARAHGGGSPTRLAVPHVLDAAEPAPRPLGLLEPPVDRYCAVRLDLGPADADAEGLQEAERLLGRSLWLLGSWTDEDGAEHPFEVLAGAERSVVLPLPGEGFAPGEERMASRLLLRFAPEAWLAGVDLAEAGRAERSRAIFSAVAEAVSVSVE